MCHGDTPTGEHCDNSNEDAIGAVLSLNRENAAREDDYEDIDDNVFCELNDWIPDNFDWSQN